MDAYPFEPILLTFLRLALMGSAASLILSIDSVNEVKASMDPFAEARGKVSDCLR